MNGKGYRQDTDLECHLCGAAAHLEYDITIENASMHAEAYIERKKFTCPACLRKEKEAEVRNAQAAEDEEEEIPDDEFGEGDMKP